MTIDISTLPEWMAALLVDEVSWSGNSGEPVTVRYSLKHNNLTSLGLDGSLPSTGSEVDDLNITQSELQNILDKISNVTGVTFVHDETNYNIVFAEAVSTSINNGNSGAITYRSLSDSTIIKADIYISDSYTTFSENDFGQFLLLHEVGHALGLDHPNGGDGTDPNFNDFVTVESYLNNISSADSPSTLMSFDIAALQFLYGTNNHNNNDTEYTINADGTIDVDDNGTASTIEGRLVTIWDSAGIDTFILESSITTDAQIDLRGGRSPQGNGDNYDDADTYSDPYFTKIENGSSDVYVISALPYNGSNTTEGYGVIENATGAQGDDLIFGNQLDNTLSGLIGQDTIYGSKGNDTITAYANSGVLEADYYHGGYIGLDQALDGYDTADYSSVLLSSSLGIKFDLSGSTGSARAWDDSTNVLSGLSDTLISIEQIIGTANADWFVGNANIKVDFIGDASDKITYAGSSYTNGKGLIVSDGQSTTDVYLSVSDGIHEFAVSSGSYAYFKVLDLGNIFDTSTLRATTISYQNYDQGLSINFDTGVISDGSETDSFEQNVNIIGSNNGDDYTFDSAFSSGSSFAPILSGTGDDTFSMYHHQYAIFYSGGDDVFTNAQNSPIYLPVDVTAADISLSIQNSTIQAENSNAISYLADMKATISGYGTIVYENTVTYTYHKSSGTYSYNSSPTIGRLWSDDGITFLYSYGSGGSYHIYSSETAASSISTSYLTAYHGTQFAENFDLSYYTGWNNYNAYGGDDTVIGSSADNTVYLGEGNDTFYASAGNDYVYGGSGNDVVTFNGVFSNYSITDNGSYITIEDLVGSDDLTYAYDIDSFKFSDTTYVSARAIITPVNGTAAGETLDGTSIDDYIIANAGDDIIVGYAGNDIVYADLGDDEIYGGDGDDLLNGGDGNDIIYFGKGIDVAYGDSGDDTYYYLIGDGEDTIADSSGSNDRIVLASTISVEDLVFSPNGDDLIITFTGYANDEILVTDQLIAGVQKIEEILFEGEVVLDLTRYSDWNFGTALGETIYGTASDDIIIGLDGYDIIYSNGGNDTLWGGSGTDELYGGSGGDILYGGDDADLLIAYGGNDYLFGGSGNDEMYVYTGNEVFDGGDGSDTLLFTALPTGITVDLALGTASTSYGSAIISNIENIYGTNAADTIKGDSLSNLLIGNQGADTIYGGAGNDTIYGDQFGGDSAVDILYGEDGNDTLIGLAGDDLLYGGAGNDVLYNYSGEETFDGGAGDADLLSFYYATAAVTVNMLTGLAVSAGETDSFSNIEMIDGSIYDDNMTGDSNANQLVGDGGNDTLYGASGNDTLSGGSGADVLYGGDGADLLYGGADSDIFVFEAANAFNAEDLIADFNVSTDDDVLDISDILDGTSYVHGVDVIADWVEITTSGSDSLVKVDTTGTATFSSGTQIVTLEGVTGLTDEAALVTSGNLIVA